MPKASCKKARHTVSVLLHPADMRLFGLLKEQSSSSALEINGPWQAQLDFPGRVACPALGRCQQCYVWSSLEDATWLDL